MSEFDETRRKIEEIRTQEVERKSQKENERQAHEVRRSEIIREAQQILATLPELHRSSIEAVREIAPTLLEEVNERVLDNKGQVTAWLNESNTHEHFRYNNSMQSFQSGTSWWGAETHQVSAHAIRLSVSGLGSVDVFMVSQDMDARKFLDGWELKYRDWIKGSNDWGIGGMWTKPDKPVLLVFVEMVFEGLDRGMCPEYAKGLDLIGMSREEIRTGLTAKISEALIKLHNPIRQY